MDPVFIGLMIVPMLSISLSGGRSKLLVKVPMPLAHIGEVGSYDVTCHNLDHLIFVLF